MPLKGFSDDDSEDEGVEEEGKADPDLEKLFLMPFGHGFFVFFGATMTPTFSIPAPLMVSKTWTT